MEHDKIDELSIEDLREILKTIPEAVVEKALDNLIDEQTKETVDLLHSLVCKQIHNIEMNKCCAYYTEPNFHEPIHQEWLAYARLTMDINRISLEELGSMIGWSFKLESLLNSASKDICPQAPAVMINLLAKAYCSQTD